MTDLAPSIFEPLKDLLGSQTAVHEKDLAWYAVEGLIPEAVVRPADRSEVARTLAWAFSQTVTVSPRGGGTLLSLGNTPTKIDLVLELAKLDQILDFQPADLTVTVEAGIHLKNLQETLAQGGMYLPLEAPLLLGVWSTPGPLPSATFFFTESPCWGFVLSFNAPLVICCCSCHF